MNRKVILSADSTCDLNKELIEKTKVNLFYFGTTLGDRVYTSTNQLDVKQMFETYYKEKLLPKTSAVSVTDYADQFKIWVDQGYDVVHINLSSNLSSAYQNCCLAAREIGHVYPVDSQNLSTGMGLLVLEAAQRIEDGMEAPQIQQEITELRAKINSSFIMEKLDFMAAGGRCSAATALGANLLGIKPCIEVNPDTGKMNVCKKYRGEMKKVLEKYIRERLANIENIRKDKIFITNSCVNEEYITLAKEVVMDVAQFDNIYETVAGVTISSHCGPNSLGVLFIEE